MEISIARTLFSQNKMEGSMILGCPYFTTQEKKAPKYPDIPVARAMFHSPWV